MAAQRQLEAEFDVLGEQREDRIVELEVAVLLLFVVLFLFLSLFLSSMYSFPHTITKSTFSLSHIHRKW